MSGLVDLPLWLRSTNLNIEHGFGHSKSLDCNEDRNSHFILPRQVHSDRILMIRDINFDKSLVSKMPADGIITDCPGLGVGIVTADCAPILINGVTHENRAFVGAIHAGWRGAIGGIIEEIARSVEVLNSKYWHAAVGPCAGRESYEVSDDFKEQVCRVRPQAESFFKIRNKKSIFFDLQGWCIFSLAKVGAETTELLDFDTISDERFFSYRRGSVNGSEEKRRQVSWVECPKS